MTNLNVETALRMPKLNVEEVSRRITICHQIFPLFSTKPPIAKTRTYNIHVDYNDDNHNSSDSNINLPTLTLLTADNGLLSFVKSVRLD